MSLKSFEEFSGIKTDSSVNEKKQKGPMEDYWNTMNPETGKRFEIPMLRFMDNNYKLKYINYMKMREEKPEEFERIMKWN